MKALILTVGKTKTGYIAEGIDVYLKRLRRYLACEIKELPDVRNAGKISEAEQKEAEGLAILATLSTSDHVVLLDERGKQFTSREFASRLENLMVSGRKRTIFVIGGPYGFSKAVYDRADEMLSFSKMTFNHEMIRLMLSEQIYRAMTILRGEPYHHD